MMSGGNYNQFVCCAFKVIFIVLSFFELSVATWTREEAASFYGESYVLNPLQDDSSSSSVSLEFRTHRPQGLLLLAAGQTDYVIVQLNAGIVETRVNLGSGEAITFSARGVRLDDTQWHSVVVNRTLDTVYLMVDGVDQGQATSPGTYHDLNIDLGVLLGGSGNLKKDFYRNAKSFRGCLRDVFFNGRNILKEARALKSAQNAFQVTWHCDDEFTVSSDSPISFSHETSFVAFPHLRIYPQSSGVFSCELKTRSPDAVILFNSGVGSTWDDFIAVELIEGRPKLSIDKGSGVVEVALESEVNDGKWHKLEVTVSETVAELQIDSEKNLTRFHLGGQNYLNLGSHLFIGGVGVKARSDANTLRLVSLQNGASMKGSMLGCMRNIKMNSRSYGFQQIQVSRLIDAGCAWEFPCAQDPCLPSAECTELEGTDFRCDCSQSVCTKEEFLSDFNDKNKDLNGIISVTTINVKKGGSAAINLDAIRIKDDFLRDFVKEENIVFTIREEPEEGIIEVRQRRGNQNTFTLRDLLSNNVYYRHFGGQSKLDSVTLEVALNSMTHGTESKLKSKYEFVLPIAVIPQERSKFEVKLGHGNVLSISSGARVQITPSVLDVSSHDINPSSLIFSVMYLRQSSSYFERSGGQKKSITSFSMKEVQDGLIWFQHNTDKIVYTRVNVTDGDRVSQVVDFRFREVDLKISIVNNTGISLSYGSECLITSYNLSAEANTKLEDLELSYHLIQPPSHGAIQLKEYDSSLWVDVESFTQSQINSGRIRYLHLPGTTIATYDSIRFEVKSKDVKTEDYVFNIRFKTVTLTIQHNSHLVLYQTPYGKFSNKSLMVVSNADKLDMTKIVYMIVRPPQKGSLYLIKRRVQSVLAFDQTTPLKTDGTFTQQDVNNGFIYYKVDKPSFEKASDFTDLQASYYGFTVIVRSMMQYSPEKTPVKFINNGLQDVPEGGAGVISKQELSLEMEKYKSFAFNIVRYPAHGILNIMDGQTVIRKNVSSFTMSEIKGGKVTYQHDDSENKEDFFTFSTSPVLEESDSEVLDEFQEFSGTFHISLKMKNDNPPVRTVSKVFQIATGQTKPLTIDDLAFTDPDIDYDDSMLMYHRQPIDNGKILRASTKEEIFNFTQNDLIHKTLVFHHQGDSYSRTPISVSDGQLYSMSLFEIEASRAYIKVFNNTGVEVKYGQFTVISGQNLSIESNLDFDLNEVVFQMIEEPKHGHLRVNGRQAQQFNYFDLLNGRVRYWQDGSDGLEDTINFNVILEQVKTQPSFNIRIVAEGLSDPPEIIHNQILKVLALQSETISENMLQVFHKDYHPREIEFIVTQLPSHGHLVIRGKRVSPGSAPEFTQLDINHRQIAYTSDSADSLSDHFVFDVGTEMQSLRQLEFLIEIIPKTLQISRMNTSVAEGGSVGISSQLLSLRGRLAQNKRVTFKVKKPPVHGQIGVKAGKKVTHVSGFSYDDVARGRVVYTHDNSESLSDEVSFKAEVPDGKTAGQLSILLISVTPVDDQPPHVILNTGLDPWTGSVTLLTTQHLQVTDPDSSSEKVEFQVTAPTNGHLAFLNNTFKQISRFTQMDLDAGRVVFVHKGSELGEFQFQATDGINRGKMQVFRVRARPVKIFVPVNKTIQAFPNSLHPITNRSLLAKTPSANFTQPIVFTLMNPKPIMGKLVTVINRRAVEINSFTQDDVDEGKVFYKHTANMISWRETDYLNFEITTTYAQPLVLRYLKFEISFSNINEENFVDLLNLKPPLVEEGKQVTISRSYFDSTEFVERIQRFMSSVTVEFSFMSPVTHGYLWFKDKDAEIGEIFTQDDLNNGALVYKHDHSDTKSDMFQFVLKLLVPRSITDPVSSIAHILNFTIEVEPLNDQRFELVTRHPKINVKQGSEIQVTAHNLTTVDLDTGPEGIEYIILTQPDNGKLVRLTHPTTRIHSFTQKEINDGLVFFKHDGTRKASSSVYFKVWDRRFDPWYANLDIAVAPLEIEVAKDSHVPLVQGKKSVTLSNEHLKVSTNGDFNALTYKVTQAPQFGKLTKHKARVTQFVQADIENGLLLYTQNEDSPGEDFFVCDIDLSNIDCSLDTVQFEIIMKPLVRQGPLVTSPGLNVAITRSSLDASELAQITNDNPLFDISTPPKYGRIMKRHRQRRQAMPQNSFQPVSNFTFEDVLFTKIYYVPNRYVKENVNDKFIYTLTAKGVPPAKGEMSIQLDGRDVNDNDFDREESEKDREPERDKDRGYYSPSEDTGEEMDEDKAEEAAVDASVGGDDNNTVIIASVLAVIAIIIIIVVLVFLFFRWRRQNQAASVQEFKPAKPRPYISGPLQLEQPHVLIEPKHEGLVSSPVSGEDTALVAGTQEENQYVNTSLISSTHEADPSSYLSSSYRSPDVTRVEVSNTVPGCRVTPMLDSQSDVTSEDTERRSTMTSGRGSNASTDLMDWTLMDPDLLQHCRTNTPVLRNNQYWL